MGLGVRRPRGQAPATLPPLCLPIWGAVGSALVSLGGLEKARVHKSLCVLQVGPVWRCGRSSACACTREWLTVGGSAVCRCGFSGTLRGGGVCLCVNWGLGRGV